MRPTIQTLQLFSLLSVLAACGNSADKVKPAAAPPLIDVMIARPGSFSYTVEASGTVQAQEFVELKPEINGRITYMNINEGSYAAAGTLLVKLNDDDLQAQLRKSLSQLEIAKKTEQRLRTLLEANGLNQQEYDVAKNQLNNLAADIDYTHAMIRKTELRAPFTGVLGLRNVSPGAYVSSGTVLATLQQTSSLKIDFVIPEEHMKLVSRGMSLNVTDNNGAKYNAAIIAIEPQVNTGTRNIKVRAQLGGNGNQLSPGAFVKVFIPAGKSDSAFLVPSNVIIPDTRNKKLALVKNGKAEFAVVQTGYRGGEMVEITEGLKEGDSIALNGILFLKPGGPVKIRSVK